jgi:hypothetical protein
MLFLSEADENVFPIRLRRVDAKSIHPTEVRRNRRVFPTRNVQDRVAAARATAFGFTLLA